MDATFTDEVKELLGKRGLKEADIADVVKNNGGRMLTNNGKNLAKKRVGADGIVETWIAGRGFSLAS